MVKRRNPEWWHVDSQGRKIGYMWPEDMLTSIESIWGHRKGIEGFSRYAGFNRTSVEKWCRGQNPIPRHVALLVLSLEKLVHRWIKPGGDAYRRPTELSHRRDFPKLDPSWLPDETKRLFALDMVREIK